MNGNPQQSVTQQTPVDRKRRFFFVTRLIAACIGIGLSLILAVGFGFLNPALGLIENFVSGLLTLATGVALAYIGGSVVDYNGGFGNFRSINRQPIDLPPPAHDPGLDDGLPRG